MIALARIPAAMTVLAALLASAPRSSNAQAGLSHSARAEAYHGRAGNAEEPVRSAAPAASRDEVSARDVLVEELAVTVRTQPDGRVAVRTRTVTLLSSFYAVNNLGDPKILYDTERQKLTIHEAATITPSGAKLDAPPHALNDSTPDAVAAAPVFSTITEKVVTFVGLEEGSHVILDYEVEDVIAWRSHVADVVKLASRFPVRKATLALRVPGRARLSTLLLDPDSRVTAAAPRLEAADSVYEWTAVDLPAYRQDKPYVAARAPRVVYSIAPDWTTVLAYFQAAVDAFPVATAPAEGRPDFSRLAARPAQPEAAALPPAMLLARGMNDSLRRVDGLPTLEARTLRPLHEVLESRQASRLEAAALLAAALSSTASGSQLQLRLVLASPPMPPILKTGNAAEPPVPPASRTSRAELLAELPTLAGGNLEVPPSLAFFEDAYVEASIDGVPVYFRASDYALLPAIPDGALRYVAVLSRSERPYVGWWTGALPDRVADCMLKTSCLAVDVALDVTVGPDRLDVGGTVRASGPASLWFDAPSGVGPNRFDAILARAFGPALTVTESEIEQADPGNTTISFLSSMAVLPGQVVALNAAPLAADIDSLVLPIVLGDAPIESLATGVAYRVSITVDGATRVHRVVSVAPSRSGTAEDLQAALAAFIAGSKQMLILSIPAGAD